MVGKHLFNVLPPQTGQVQGRGSVLAKISNILLYFIFLNVVCFLVQSSVTLGSEQFLSFSGKSVCVRPTGWGYSFLSVCFHLRSFTRSEVSTAETFSLSFLVQPSVLYDYHILTI